MPGGFIPCVGGSAPVVRQWHGGLIADTFNCIYPQRQTTNVVSSAQHQVLSSAPANFVSNWHIYNTQDTGGSNADTAFLTTGIIAPDGSSTAVKIVETATNSEHSVVAGHPGNPLGVERPSIFLRAAERTRVAIYIHGWNFSGGIFGQRAGARCVFDLAGGQVGVAPAAFNDQNYGFSVTGYVEIIPVGGGWYRCAFDLVNGFASCSSTFVRILLDAGSGTAAENSSYAGNGTSGVYAWTARSLPRGCWGWGDNLIFNDDFNDPTTIDTGNTKLPGKNWYLWNTPTLSAPFTGPGWDSSNHSNCDPGNVNVAGSVLTLGGSVNSGGHTLYNLLNGAAPDGTNNAYPGGYVAGPRNVWQPPIWVQTRFARWYGSPTIDELASWSVSTNTYNSGDGVYRSGVTYQAVTGANLGNDPALTTPTNWSTPFPPFNNQGAGFVYPQYDPTQMNTVDVLWFPWDRSPNPTGMILIFYNGRNICSQSNIGLQARVYGGLPYTAPSPWNQNVGDTRMALGAESAHNILNLQGDHVAPRTIQIDWVKMWR
jgi:hypothetical protein